MYRLIKLTEANDLRDFMNLAVNAEVMWGCIPIRIRLQMQKSILGLMALDYNEPVKVVTEDEAFLKKLDKWAVDM